MVVADFFLKVHGLRWVAVCGVSAGRVVVVFRGGYGKMDLGAVASCVFPGIGGGGGHKTMARAEAALVDVPVEARSGLEEYVFQLIYAAAEKRRRAMFASRGTGADSPAAAGADSAKRRTKGGADRKAAQSAGASVESSGREKAQAELSESGSVPEQEEAAAAASAPQPDSVQEPALGE